MSDEMMRAAQMATMRAGAVQHARLAAALAALPQMIVEEMVGSANTHEKMHAARERAAEQAILMGDALLRRLQILP